MTTETKIIKHFKDLDFTVVAEPNSHYVDYIIYDIKGWVEGDTPGVFDKPLWGDYQVDVDDLENAEPYIHGEVKWDGCSNWHFDEQDRIMLHGCCKKDIQRFGDVLARCWEWTAELCPSFDAEE